MLARSNAQNQGEFHNDVNVVDEHGNKLTVKKAASKGNPTGVSLPTETMVFFPLNPGESLKDSISISKMYDMTKPGKYQVQVQRTDPESKVIVKSNTIGITVTP